MTDQDVDAVNGVGDMERMKIIWTFNPITIGSIVLAVISGTIYINTIKNETDANASHIASIETALSGLNDIPFRTKQIELSNVAQAEKDKAQDARMDRQSDLILDGQEKMRITVQAGFDGIKKDVSQLSTKVEVIGSKMGFAQPGSFHLK